MRCPQRIQSDTGNNGSAEDSTLRNLKTHWILLLVSSTGGNTPIDPQMQTVVNSVTVERHGNKALVTANKALLAVSEPTSSAVCFQPALVTVNT